MNVRLTVESLEDRLAPSGFSLRDFIGSVIAARTERQLAALRLQLHRVGPLRQLVIAREILILQHVLSG